MGRLLSNLIKNASHFTADFETCLTGGYILLKGKVKKMLNVNPDSYLNHQEKSRRNLGALTGLHCGLACAEQNL